MASPLNFFRFFWQYLKTFMIRSLNFAYFTGELSQSQKLGIIILIPKGNKPRHLLKNWRPISLLNVIYKIASGCIANRLKQVLPHLIHENQKGFLKGRFIGENIRLLYDILLYTERAQSQKKSWNQRDLNLHLLLAGQRLYHQAITGPRFFLTCFSIQIDQSILFTGCKPQICLNN